MHRFLQRLKRFWFPPHPWESVREPTPEMRRAAWCLRVGQQRAAEVMREAERRAELAIRFGRFANVAERIAAGKTLPS
jgi:hypothetical protein